MKLRWTHPALADLRDLHAYIAAHNPGAALKLARLIRAHAEGLATHPEKGRSGRIEGTRELVVTGTRFIIAYRLTPETIDLLAIRHGAREWMLAEEA